MKYIEFKLVEGYKEVTQKFAQEADPTQVSDMIAKYKDLVNRNQVQGNERNIDWWGKQGWKNFTKFVDAKSQQQSQNQQKKRKQTGNSYTLDETNKWLIVVPLDKDASCFHGKGTDWCTTKPEHDYFEKYFRDDSVTLIYFLQKQTGAKWAVAVYPDGNAEFFDKNDRSIGNGDLADQTGIPLANVMKYVNMVTNRNTDVSKQADTARSGMHQDQKNLKNIIDDLKRTGSKERSVEAETLLLKTKDKEFLKQYMDIVLNGESVEMDQNMQTLIASSLPSKLENISNVTAKSFGILVKNHPGEIQHFIKRHKDLALNTFKRNPALIPELGDMHGLDSVDREFQKVFIEHNPLWMVIFDEDLDQALAAQKGKVLSAWFNKNPRVFALVVEPGLTDLVAAQALTQAEYKKAANSYGTDAFEVINRDLEKLRPE